MTCVTAANAISLILRYVDNTTCIRMHCFVWVNKMYLLNDKFTTGQKMLDLDAVLQNREVHYERAGSQHVA